MTIIVESGATKADWRVLNPAGEQVQQFFTEGTNVSSMPLETVKERIVAGISMLKPSAAKPALRVDAIYFYTAGVVSDSIRDEIISYIKNLVDVGTVEIENDLLAAARAVCGRENGIVAILGTGSNACLYDGRAVGVRAYSGGFILGDEGGAAALGRMFVSEFIKDRVPVDVAQDMAAHFELSYDAIVEKVYHGPAPAAYLGSFAPRLLDWYGRSDYVRALVDLNFRNFIERVLFKYPVDEFALGVTGGFGFACKDIFSRLAAGYGLRLGRFVPAPIEGLLDFHSAQ